MSHGDAVTSSSDIKIRVLFFAAARDAVDGLSQIDIVFDSKLLASIHQSNNNNDDNNSSTITLTANNVRDYLMEQYPRLHPYIHHEIGAITMALNEVYIPHGTDPMIQNNDVIAIIPPISGG
jgi:molybdopterin converting factor small subunit